MIIPFEWDVLVKEAQEPLSASGIIWDEASQKIGLLLQALQLPEGLRWRYLFDGLDLEGVHTNPLLGHNKTYDFSCADAKDTLEGVQA